ncbi:MAG: sialidase family protein [Candidatus Dormibacteria bacterium]
MKRFVSSVIGAGMVLALALAIAPVSAAQPAAGTLSFANPKLSWANASPMNGSAPATRRYTCQEPTACDDFALTLDRGTDTNAAMDVVMTPVAPATFELIHYPPGCATDVTSTCYVDDGQEANLLNAPNGKYVFRVTCTTCANASYSAVATLSHQASFNIPAAGDQSFKWSNKKLPPLASGTDPTYGEPGIATNARGHIIINTFGPTVWISQDNGKTFSPANSSVDPTGCPSGDADGALSFDDAYYTDNLCTGGPTNLSYTSRDGGKTWNQGTMNAPSPAGTDSDRQWYATDPKNPGVIYFSYHDLAGPNIWVLKSTDYGQTFPQQVPITVQASKSYIDTGQGNTTARPLVDPENPQNVYALYTSNTAEKSATALPTRSDFDLTQIYMAKSTDGGLTWTNTLLFDAGTSGGLDNVIAHEFPSDAIDNNGNVYVAFSERLGDKTQTHVRLGVIPRGSAKFLTDPVQVDQGLSSNVFPAVAAGDAGRVDVTWYGSPALDANDHKAQWSQMFSQTQNALNSPIFAQSRVSGDKPMHTADICLAGTLCLATGGNRDLADFQSVALDPCGMAQMVYTNDTGAGYTVFAMQGGGPSVLAHAPTGCVQAASTASPAPVGPSPSPALPNTSSPGPGAPVRMLALLLAILGGVSLKVVHRGRGLRG